MQGKERNRIIMSMTIDKKKLREITGNVIMRGETISQKTMNINDAILGCTKVLQKNQDSHVMSIEDKSVIALLLGQASTALRELLLHSTEEGTIEL